MSARGPVRSEMGWFALIPGWLFQTASPQAGYVYGVLAGKYADREGVSFPSHKTLAEDLGVSPATIRRALKELEDIGAVVVQMRFREDGSRSSNEYVIAQAEPPCSPVSTPLLTSEQAPPAPVSRHEPDPMNQRKSRAAAPREKDEVWDAVEAACGPVTNAATRSKRGKAVKLIKESLPEGWTEGQAAKAIGYRVRRYRELYQGAVLTDVALANQWDALAPPQRRRQAVRPMVCTDCGVSPPYHAADCPQASKEKAA